MFKFFSSRKQSELPNRFRIDSLIGEGGMAFVYLAFDQQLQRQVAVKVLKNQENDSSHPSEELLAEAISTAKIDHPNIVSIYDVTSEGSSCFIVMEYVDGINLKSALKRHGAFEAPAVAHIGIEMCSALEKAHLNGVVHSDIKPSNMLLTRTDAIKLTDFGIARIRANWQDSNAGLGTPQYASPQQAHAKPAASQDDVYSLGVSLYELCCNQLPSTALGPVAQNGIRPNHEPIKPSEINDTANEDFDRILFTSMQHDASDRYETARHFRKDLEGFLASHPLGTKPILPRNNAPEFWVLVPEGQTNSQLDGYLVTEQTVIGRSRDVDIALRPKTVSKHHAKLTPWGACLLLEDLESSNGTLLNDQPVTQRTTCYPGDVITIGGISFIIGCKKG